MSLQTLPEDYLYRLIPEGVVELDTRGIIQAVCGGYQDRVEDLRSLAGKYELLLDPLADIAKSSGNVTQITYTGGQGNTIVRSVDTPDNIPLDTQFDTTAEYEAALITWAAELLDIDSQTISDVSTGTDVLKVVSTSTLQYLAATIGAVLYKTQTTGEAATLAEHQRILSGYFPRLKVKGTATSFELLGRLMNFGDVKMTPLWSRVSPRLPNDIGNTVNDPDFLSSPDIFPEAETSATYDPNDMDDGPFYSWDTGGMTTDPEDSTYYEYKINGVNPWFNVVIADTGTAEHPPTGTYALAGGDNHVRASVIAVASGTGVAEMKFEAITEGDSFNGVPIVVPATGSVVVTDQRLSTVKYRSSYYDLSLTTEFDRFVDAFGDQAVTKNTDLSPADGGDPDLTDDGTAIAPYRPWQGASPRTQADPTLGHRQVDLNKLNELGLQAMQNFDEVRPATRFPRRVKFGFLMNDQVEYAPFLRRFCLFESDGTVLSSTGTVGQDDRPLDPITTVFTIESPSGDVTVTTGETDSVDPDKTNFAASGFTGYYHNGSHDFFVQFDTAADGQKVVANWTPASTEVVRTEPSDALKQAGSVEYLERPEDELTFVGYSMSEEYEYRRGLLLEGVDVDTGGYNPSVEDASAVEVDEVLTVLDQSGIQWDLTGIDGLTPTSPEPIYITMSERDITASDYQPGRKAYAIKDNQLYPVGNMFGVLLADPSQFDNSVFREGLTDWFMFNEHEEQDKVVTSTVPYPATNSLSAEILSTHRTFDNNVGWNLTMPASGTVSSVLDRTVTDSFSMSFWINPATLAGAPTFEEILDHGPIRAYISIAGTPQVRFAGWNGSAWTTLFSLSVTADTFNYVYLRRSGDDFYAGVGTLTTAVPSEFSVTDPNIEDHTVDDSGLYWYGASRSYKLHNFRYWNVTKTSAEMEQLRTWTPKKTAVHSKPPYFKTRKLEEWWALSVLPSGYVVPTNDFTIHQHAFVWASGTTGIQDLTLNNVPLVPGSVMFEHASSTTWDNGGTIVPSGDITGGTVDYTTGSIVVNVSTGSRTRIGYDFRSTDFNREQLTLVQRYQMDGQFQGEERFREVGVGGGTLVPQWQLGMTMYEVPASGTIVFQTQHSAVPNANDAWDGTASSIVKVSPPYTDAGGVVTGEATSGTTNPDMLVQQNPGHQHVWVQGDDGFPYRVHVEFNGTAYLAAERPSAFRNERTILTLDGSLSDDDAANLEISEMRANGETRVSTGSEYLSVREAVGSAYSPGQVGIDTTVTTTPESPTYRGRVRVKHSSESRLSKYDRVVVVVTSAVAGIAAGTYYGDVMETPSLVGTEYQTTVRLEGLSPANWTPASAADSADTTSWQMYYAIYEPYIATGAIDQTPDVYLYNNEEVVYDANGSQVYQNWDDPTALITNASGATIDEAGLISFTNDGSLEAGDYQLTIDAGNIGRVDDGFTGFNVNVQIGDEIVTDVLVEGGAGYQPRDETTMGFTFGTVVADPWTLSVDWTNDRDVGEAFNRQLFIYGYTLKRINTKLYKLSNTDLGLVEVSIDEPAAPPATPGGWLGRLNMYGTVEDFTHEGRIHPELTITAERSQVPMSNLITGVTIERNEDFMVTSYGGTATTPLIPDAPTIPASAVSSGTYTVS